MRWEDREGAARSFPRGGRRQHNSRGRCSPRPTSVCPVETGLGSQGWGKVPRSSAQPGPGLFPDILGAPARVGVPGPHHCPGSRGPAERLSPFSGIIPFELFKKKKKGSSERTLPDNTKGIFPRDRPKADSHLKTCPKWSCPSEQIPQACPTPLPAAPPPGPAAARPAPRLDERRAAK